jgi:hypothetical protein
MSPPEVRIVPVSKSNAQFAGRAEVPRLDEDADVKATLIEAVPLKFPWFAASLTWILPLSAAVRTQAPVHSPFPIGVRFTIASPLEKVATTPPLLIELPQLSATAACIVIEDPICTPAVGGETDIKRRLGVQVETGGTGETVSATPTCVEFPETLAIVKVAL